MADETPKKKKVLITLTPEAREFVRELREQEARTFSEVVDEILRSEHRRRKQLATAS